MRKTREEKAITLIALIITIVVLLIIAVVAINAVTGDGIIQHATNAKTEYKNAQAKEEGILSYYQEYLDANGDLGPWVQEKTTIKNKENKDTIEVGDYVDYKTSSNEVIQWRVLGVENGKILLMSTENIAMTRLEGEYGYLNGSAELNKLCENYDNGNGAVKGSARSIKVEDINRITGYNPLKTGNGEIYKKDDVRQHLNRVTYTLTEQNKIRYASTVKSGVSTEEASLQSFTHINGTRLVTEDEYEKSEEKNGIAKEITVECNMYLYYPTTLTDSENGAIKGIDKGNAYNLLFADENNNYYEYWIASTFINTTEGFVGYGMRLVNNGMVFANNLYQTYPRRAAKESGVRAVITLASDIELKEDGDNAWKINVIN